MRLRAPDLIRQRQDGSNELFGIGPDVEIDEDSDRDDPAVWIAAILRALRAD